MKRRLALSSEDAAAIVAACKMRATELGRASTIAVVDETGFLLHLERPDSLGPVSAEAAFLKARTGFFYERPTSLLAQRIAERPGFLAMPEMLAVPGGLPLLVDGHCVGGVGVGGADKDDETIARAGADVMESRGPGAS